jgi:mannose-1-phosphate guanylyltransferase/mannose-6-phosphate isomerase
MFRAKDMISAFERSFQETLQYTKNAVETAKIDLGFVRLNPEFWKQIEDISIDHAIMEKAKNLVSIPFASKWSDLGDWDAVWGELDKDDSGVALSGDAYGIDCKNTLLRSESKSQYIMGLGLTDIIAVAMPDAVLVAHKNKSQDVKKVVEYLKFNNVAQAEIFPKHHRPWGWFESLSISEQFQVKRIFVNPKSSLSLQSHNHRSEHWVLVVGVAKVTIGKKVQMLKENQSVYIPVREVHRLENLGKVPVVLIEVQTGNYLGEDDIVRYEDMYTRE